LAWWIIFCGPFFVGRFVICGPLGFLWTVDFFCRPFLWAVLVGRYITVFRFSWLGLVDYFLWAVFCGIFVADRAVVGGGPFEVGEFMAGSLWWAVFGGRFRQPPTHKRAGA